MAFDLGHTNRDPLARNIARRLYRTGVGLRCALATRGPTTSDTPRVFYAGGRPGDVGGPRVKIQRLKSVFPEHRNDFNLVYVLSNAPHLPTFALKRLRARRVPIVHNQNGVFYGGWFAGDWQARNADMARSYHLADYVFWQSQFCRNSADKFLGARSGPGEVLFNAVDTANFSPRTSTSPRSPYRFLTTGKIDGHLFYRLAATLRGLAAAREAGLSCSLTIAGWRSTDATRATTTLIDDLELAAHVELVGAYTQDAAPKLYRNADAYITMKHNDPCPNAVIEALACGLPVVYSATGGVPELVGEEAGVSLPCDPSWERPHWPEPEAIAGAMTTVAANHSIMSVAARKHAVLRFSLTDWVDRHRRTFERLL